MRAKSSPILSKCCEFNHLCRRWGSVPSDLKYGINRYYDYVCQYCDQAVDELPSHVDHIVSQANGGQHCICNLILACVPCNRRKGRHPLTPDQERRAKALARVAAPELARYLQERAAVRRRERARLRPKEAALERKASERTVHALLERLLRPRSRDAVCRKRLRWWGTLLAVRRRGKLCWLRDGIFVIEGARCGWADPSVVVVIKVDSSKGKRRIFELAEAYSFDRSRGTLAPYPGGMPAYAMAWLEQHREDLVEDFTIFYDGRHRLPRFQFQSQQQLLPRPRLAIRGRPNIMLGLPQILESANTAAEVIALLDEAVTVGVAGINRDVQQ
jgi:HNH endonuclease